ncbi:MAG: IS1 family transposase [Bacteroidetes bacterium]|nr:MAG: IS1 family transposase [Bacteroidota bacterium]
MITTTLHCAKFDSINLIKNGTNGAGNPKYKCKDCGYGGAIKPKRLSEEEKEKAVKQYQEKSSSRGVSRTFGVSYQSVLRWAKKKP